MSKRRDVHGYAASECIYHHFDRTSGRPNTCCGAGVDCRIWRRLGHEQVPCYLDDKGHSKPGAAYCPHLRRPTPEEIAAHEQQIKQIGKKMRIVKSAIVGWRNAHRGQFYACEVIECPACKGRLHLSIFCNGHVHGDCETHGCVSWVE